MKIKTRPCHGHRRRYGWAFDHAAHSYRILRYGPARRCPKVTTMADAVQWSIDHPNVERQTLNELRRIRQLLEQGSGLPT